MPHDLKRSLLVVFVALVAAVAGIGARSLLPHSRSVHNEALFYQSEFVSVPDGTLIRAQGDERVYYAHDGRKRWIDSARTFEAQGFRPEDVRTLTSAELTRYPEGEPITILTRLVLSSEQKVLPDLAPLAPYDLRFSTVAGRTVIRFTGSFWNKGYRAFKLISENQIATGGLDGTEDVYQHVESEDGTIRKTFAGTFVWHQAHSHHHYGDFAEYIIEPVKVAAGVPALPMSSGRQKTTFCIRDDQRMPADVPHAPLRPVFTTCGKDGQGVSAGWIDVYASTLPDQYVDVHDFPPGVYALSFLLDPKQRFIEEHADNNIATTLVEIDVQRRVLRIVAALSPFPALRNTIVDGTLLQDAEQGAVYVVQHGRKRWLRSADIFNSYGYAWDAIYRVTNAMAEAIPSQILIRRQGTAEVYALNEQGYRRHIPNPEVFASYGFVPADVVDINDLEFAAYPAGNLIMHSGDEQVYWISGMTKTALGSLASLQSSGYDLNGLHLVNDIEFGVYQSIAR
jgi:hypothetical protein